MVVEPDAIFVPLTKPVHVEMPNRDFLLTTYPNSIEADALVKLITGLVPFETTRPRPSVAWVVTNPEPYKAQY